jgi:hypothetical protein
VTLTTQKKIDRLNYLCENEKDAEEVYPLLLDLTKTLLSYLEDNSWFEDVVQDVCLHVLYESKIREEVAEGKKYGNFWRTYLVRLHQRFLDRYLHEPSFLSEQLRFLSKNESDDPLGGSQFLRMKEKHLHKLARNGELFRVEYPKVCDGRVIQDPVQQFMKSSSMDFLLDVYS